jgi:putative nucleotidyltransferase with HDIG domain
MDQVSKIIKFVEDSFTNSNYPPSELDSKQYRLEHTFRVANIGKQIANQENLNVDAMVVACLFHDISYIETFNSQDDWKNHGRRAAEIAKPLVEALDFDQKTKSDILYGIAIHVDGKSDFEGEDNVFALSVSDADNIDRFDAYRFYEMLKYNKFETLSYDEKVEFINKQTERFTKLLNEKFATVTATNLFHEKIKFSLDFLSKLCMQLENSKTIK